jgi:selenide,water dikinase
MSCLNSAAKDESIRFDISACTDVTGFGLLGHACEMIENQDIGLRIDTHKIPLIEKAMDFANMGIVPAGTHRNRDFRQGCLKGYETIKPSFMDVLFDPQTSGGLLIAVKREEGGILEKVLREKGVKDASIIGEFVDEPKRMIILQD